MKEQPDLDLEYELKILGAMKSRIKGNPLCHRSGCHGAGTLGIKIVLVDGIKKPQLLTCPCAAFGETEYKRLEDAINSHANKIIDRSNSFSDELQTTFHRLSTETRTLELSMRNFFLSLDETLIKIQRSTPFGFIAWKLGEAGKLIRRTWHSLIKRITK